MKASVTFEISTVTAIASAPANTLQSSTRLKSALCASSHHGCLMLILTLLPSDVDLPSPLSVTSVCFLYSLRSTVFPPCALSDSTTRIGLPSLSRSVNALNVKSFVDQFWVYLSICICISKYRICSLQNKIIRTVSSLNACYVLSTLLE